MKLGERLPEGLALLQQQALPKAVCYRLDEVASFHAAAVEMFEKHGVPEEERGIAMMPGIHLMKDKAYGKPTIMLVATRYLDDPDERQVTAIHNSVLAGGEFEEPKGIDDLAFDAGSLWP